MNTGLRPPRPPRIFAVLMLLSALVLLSGGLRLIILGGSFYYLLAGLALAASGVFLWRGNPLGALLYGLYFLATVVWGLFEVGLDLWALLPRLLIPALVGAWLLMPWTRRRLQMQPERSTLALVAWSGLVAILIVAGVLHREPVGEISPRVAQTKSSPAATDWKTYGNSAAGTRYSALDQINDKNVSGLKVAWQYRTGVGGNFKATPIQVNDLLYACTGGNVIVALDAETGALRWRHDPKVDVPPMGGFGTTCRGVTYYKAPADYSGECAQRIFTGTTDARLIAVDAIDGKLCEQFGVHGEIDLLKDMGQVKKGYYFVTSPPTIARGRVIVGGWVADNVEVNEPPGVVRAFDAISGKFSWAWDMGRPNINTEPAAGETYTRGTPNMWSVASVDEALGLIYLPIGNGTPDYFGAHRSAEMEKYASSIAALDATNGSVRWAFQTVHHDIWDYDVPSQPVLVDLREKDGSVTPALIQPTKRGELFVLDRRDGKPVVEVEERPVPQGAVQGDHTAKTQPFSLLPNFRGPALTEADMWGTSPFDQLWCRIAFRKLRYEGHFTPPSLQGSLQQPGNAGGFNWGSVAVDEDDQLLVVNPLIMSIRVQLIPRAEVAANRRGGTQLGTPYAVSTSQFMSPLLIPCVKPPYSKLAVVDLQTRQVVWSKPLGTTNESGPWGMKIRVALPMGVPLSAGSMVTKGGLIFVGGTQDRYLRAVNVRSGEELWRDYLPGTAQATPMTYLTPQSHRQMIVLTVPATTRSVFADLAAGKTAVPEEPNAGGYIIAYALPPS